MSLNLLTWSYIVSPETSLLIPIPARRLIIIKAATTPRETRFFIGALRSLFKEAFQRLFCSQNYGKSSQKQGPWRNLSRNNLNNPDFRPDPPESHYDPRQMRPALFKTLF